MTMKLRQSTACRVVSPAVLLVLFFSVVSVGVENTQGWSGESGVEVAIGSAIQLAAKVDASDETGLVWTSADATLVQVFDNGFCFGVSPGITTIEAVSQGDGMRVSMFRVRVVDEPSPVIDPQTIREFSDNRKFVRDDGQVCYGSELNSRQPKSEATVSNRVINPNPPTQDKLLWLVEEDAPVVDGVGSLIGTIAPRKTATDVIYASRFNHGMTKIINGEIHIYAFGAKVRSTAGPKTGVSAWLALDDVLQKESLLELYHPGTGRLPALPLMSQRFIITGGDPASYRTKDGTPLSIVRNIRIGAQPEHYLSRPAGTVNIIYCVPGFGLGGHGLDSFLLSCRLIFTPAEGVRRFTMPTYYPQDHPQAGEKAPPTMTFVYGAVDVAGSPRIFGWVASEALEPIK